MAEPRLVRVGGAMVSSNLYRRLIYAMFNPLWDKYMLLFSEKERLNDSRKKIKNVRKKKTC